MENNLLMRDEDLINNSTTRLPICLCLDVSGSMSGAPIDELNQAVRLFYDEIRKDEIAVDSAEICIIAFGSEVECLADFATLAVLDTPPMLYANGRTLMGEAVNMALDFLDQRKSEYRGKGVDYYQPWLVLMTDGMPNGNSGELDRAMGRTQQLVMQKKLTVFPLAVGAKADAETLQQFSPTHPILRLNGLRFKEFFKWLSKSVSKVSQSSPGQEIDLLKNIRIEDWNQPFA